MKQQVRKKTTTSPGSKQIPLPTGVSINSRLTQIISYIAKYGWDLAGIFLLLIAALILLGLLGLSRGLVTSALVTLVRRALGWGGYGLALLLAGLGVIAIRYKAGKPFPLRFGQFIAIEMAFFMLLPILTFISQATLVESEAGKGGGTLGWGFMHLLPGWIGFLVYLGIFVLSMMIVSGVWQRTFHGILGWSQLPIPSDQPSDVNERMIKAKRIPMEISKSKSNEPPLVQKTAWRDDRLPPINLLHSERTVIPDPNQIREKALTIEHTLAEFSIPVKVVGYRIGPTVTQFALEPGFTTKTASDGTVTKQKVRVSQIAGLTRDLTLALSASRLRIETPVPGRPYVGIEVPNSDGFIVRLRPILESDEYLTKKSPLALGLGKNVSGEPVVADLGKMPHLLIAGTTNSGKSVCLAALITCMVMNNTPHDLRLVMLDPKMVELVRFNGIPHLLGKVETELERMLAVLRWAQVEMDNRYRLMAEARVRNLEGYNRKMLQKKQDTLPRIVILVDELADLMMSAPDQTEHSLIRLAQMARATGIHMIVATQRPSTDIVTGLIKANFPARIAFAVASSVDSRVILDSNGAEDLLGKGDMLFMDPTKSGLQRIQGIMISDVEVEKIINHWQKITSKAEETSAPWENLISEATMETSDQLIEKAIGVVKAAGKASASLLQRRLRVGYPRAARLIDELEEMGIIGPSVGSGKDRELLVDSDDDQSNSMPEDY
jgi:S-DNA-T family DNA segregation ATPase FtsK/SpoIIIE